MASSLGASELYCCGSRVHNSDAVALCSSHMEAMRPITNTNSVCQNFRSPSARFSSFTRNSNEHPTASTKNNVVR